MGWFVSRGGLTMIARWVVAVVSAVLAATLAEPAAAAPRVAVAPAARTPVSASQALERPDLATAQVLARRTGKRVEVTGEHTEFSRTWADPHGSVTVDASASPRWVRRTQDVYGKKATSWVPVDATLVASAEPGGRITPRATSSGLTLSPGGDAAVASVRRDGVELHAGLPTGWRSLPAPELSGGAATYRGVRPGIDLVVTASTTGFEVNWVLTERPKAAPTLELPLTLKGVTATRRSDGSVAYTDAAGQLRAAMPAPVMWQAPATSGRDDDEREALPGGRVRRAEPDVEPVAMTLVPGARTTVGQAVSLTVRPDAEFLAEARYPVTVDPVVSWTVTMDTYAASQYGSTHATATPLKIGYDGWSAYRTYFQAPAGLLNALRDNVVSAASLSLYGTLAWGCSSTGDSRTRVEVYENTAAATAATIWTNKPARTSVTPKATTQLNDAAPPCGGGAAYVPIDITQVAKDWATEAYTVPVVEVGALETSWHGYKEFASNESSTPPTFTVTYNIRPNTPTELAPAAGVSIPATTVEVSGAVTDADGGEVAGVVYVRDVTAENAWVTPRNGTVCEFVASGGRSTCTLTGLDDGHTYSWYLNAIDRGNVVSYDPLPARTFSVDVSAPAAPTVTSSQYPKDGWNTVGGAGTFTFTSPSSTAASFRYWFDTADSATVATTVSGSGSSAVSLANVTLTPPAGWTTLRVEAVDAANNASDTTTYAFGAGVAVTAPGEGDIVQTTVRLDAVAPPGATGVTFDYQLSNATTWTTIPADDVWWAGYAVAWPMATETSDEDGQLHAPGNLVWNAADTLGPVDAVVRVRARFSNGSTTWTTLNTPTVTVDRSGFAGASASVDVGPGTVDLETGNYAVSATDVALDGLGPDLSVSRTFNSFTPTQSDIFVPRQSS